MRWVGKTFAWTAGVTVGCKRVAMLCSPPATAAGSWVVAGSDSSAAFTPPGADAVSDGGLPLDAEANTGPASFRSKLNCAGVFAGGA